jgi:hypothetical protein
MGDVSSGSEQLKANARYWLVRIIASHSAGNDEVVGAAGNLRLFGTPRRMSPSESHPKQSVSEWKKHRLVV